MSSLISDDTGLAAACHRWSAAGLIGIDTEFIRERTYFPRPGLVQVADVDGVTLVDPLGISDFGPLASLLTDPSVVKLMHACDEDLDVLELLTGVTPRGVWDSQLAGVFAGYGFAPSYGGLVEALLDVVLDKGLTRSNWLKRPLSSEQLRYAALDVVYLAPMYARLSRKLTELGRMAWYEEEFGYRRRAWEAGKRPEAAYLRVRGRGALGPAKHAVLRALSEWRETEALARDLPRRHLLADEVLMALASAPDLDLASLDQIVGFSKQSAARYGQTIVMCIDEARAKGPSAIDTPVNLRPHVDTINRLKEIVQREAENYKLPPELLASRRALESLVTAVVIEGDDPPVEFQGWRREVVTTQLLDSLRRS